MALLHLPAQRQLFVDDYLIESMRRTRPVMNPAEKVVDNPVLRPDRPWEGNYLAPLYVVFDPAEGQFRMWYSAAYYYAYRKDDGTLAYGPEDNDATRPGVVCYATSPDGIHWEKPEMGVVAFDGSMANNIIPDDWYRPFMFRDERESGPAKRFKGLVRRGAYDGYGMQFDLYYSPDGFHWSAHGENPIIDTTPRYGRWGPTLFHGWDPIRQTYHAHMENCQHFHCPLAKRLVGRAESPDMIHWSEPETIILPDEQDPPDLEFYYMACLPYADVYLGFLCAFRTNTTSHHVQLAVSRDGIHYARRHREPFLANGGKAEFDCSSIYPLDPLVHDDRLLCYYQGVNWRSVETLYELGDRALGAVGLATLPADGLITVDGGRNDFSEVTTRAFGFTGRRLAVTLQAHLTDGWEPLCDVRAELLTAGHMPIPGFTFNEADPVTRSAQRQIMSWQGQSDLSALQQQPLKIRFYLKNAKMHAFEFLA